MEHQAGCDVVEATCVYAFKTCNQAGQIIRLLAATVDDEAARQSIDRWVSEWVIEPMFGTQQTLSGVVLDPHHVVFEHGV